MESQISAIDCVYGWNPNKAAPAEIESCAVYHDINSLIITSFPPKEFGDVNHLQNDVDLKIVGDMSIVLLKLIEPAAENNQWPHCHSHSTVGPNFDIEIEAESWVQLSAPKVVREEVA